MRVLRPLVAAAAALFVLAAPASARDVRVALDQAFPIRLSEPAEGVAIGNPSIAGVTVQNDQFLFVTGRSYGSTNLVVIGQNGRVLYSGRVVVSPDETDAVMVTRGVETQRIECTPLCRPRPDIGDGETASTITDQINNRAAAAAASRR